MSTPVIPGNPPPVFPTSAPPPGTVYGNPLATNRDRDERSQQQPPPASPAWNNKPFVSGSASPAWGNKPFGTPGGGGGAPPSPSWSASSPAAWGTNNAFGAPGVSGSGGGGVSSPREWGGESAVHTTRRQQQCGWDDTLDGSTQPPWLRRKWDGFPRRSVWRATLRPASQ